MIRHPLPGRACPLCGRKKFLLPKNSQEGWVYAFYVPLHHSVVKDIIEHYMKPCFSFREVFRREPQVPECQD
jgi:hypothetical protein